MFRGGLKVTVDLDSGFSGGRGILIYSSRFGFIGKHHAHRLFRPNKSNVLLSNYPKLKKNNLGYRYRIIRLWQT